MITKFTTVYAGRVDLPDSEKNARRPRNTGTQASTSRVSSKTEALAEKMDALGFDTRWLAEEVMPTFKPPGR